MELWREVPDDNPNAKPCPEDEFKLLKLLESLFLAYDMSFWKLPKIDDPILESRRMGASWQWFSLANACPEDGFKLLKLSKSLLLAWDTSICKLPKNLVLLPQFFAPSTNYSWKHIQYPSFFFSVFLWKNWLPKAVQSGAKGSQQAQQCTWALWSAALHTDFGPYLFPFLTW